MKFQEGKQWNIWDLIKDNLAPYTFWFPTALEIWKGGCGSNVSMDISDKYYFCSLQRDHFR